MQVPRERKLQRPNMENSYLLSLRITPLDTLNNTISSPPLVDLRASTISKISAMGGRGGAVIKHQRVIIIVRLQRAEGSATS